MDLDDRRRLVTELLEVTGICGASIGGRKVWSWPSLTRLPLFAPPKALGLRDQAATSLKKARQARSINDQRTTVVPLIRAISIGR